MLADIHGKVSRSGTNLSERLEDNLTGNVFGSLRYIPFNKGPGKIFNECVKHISYDFSVIQEDYWNEAIKFWPTEKEGELDILIEFEHIIIGVEVKLYSGLSSDDGISYMNEHHLKSNHQLARESRIINRLGGDKQKILLFIADRNICKNIYSDVIKRDLIEKSVAFDYITWQDFLHSLKKLSCLTSYEKLIIQDLIQLLQKKGFEDFQSLMVDSKNIDFNQYFKFNSSSIPHFSFDIKTNIKEDIYYEFK